MSANTTSSKERAGPAADDELFDSAKLTPNDIQTFVAKIVEGEGEAHRKYKINPPPMDRPARTILYHAERLEAVKNCKWVDEVVGDAPWVVDEEFIEKYKIDYVAHDEDDYNSVGYDDVYGYLKSQGKFIPTRRIPGLSTSNLLERIVVGYRNKEFDKKLTKIGRSELRAEGSAYDTQSRKASWTIWSGTPAKMNHFLLFLFLTSLTFNVLLSCQPYFDNFKFGNLSLSLNSPHPFGE